jgi:arylsulfatase A-like enzyme
LWLHLFDPHTPYGPPAAYANGYAERWKSPRPDALAPATLPELDVLPPEMRFLEGVKNAELPRWNYAVEVAHADALVENLASNLAERGWLGRTAWVITADHGESLGERNSWFNHAGLFPEVTHVPLILNLPGGPEGERVEAPVSTVDIAPTLCTWLGLGTTGMRGIDLLALADGDAAPERRLLFEASDGEMAGWLDAENYYVEVTHPQARFGLEIARDAQGRRVAANRALKPGSAWLFDRASDPSCAKDLAESQAARRDNCKAELAKLRAGLRGGATIERDMDPAQLEQMRKLGYAGR